ncbi:MAG: hypothetical protein ACMUIS_08620 [bacterium]
MQRAVLGTVIIPYLFGYLSHAHESNVERTRRIMRAADEEIPKTREILDEFKL